MKQLLVSMLLAFLLAFTAFNLVDFFLRVPMPPHVIYQTYRL